MKMCHDISTSVLHMARSKIILHIYRVQSNESQYNYIKLKPEFMTTVTFEQWIVTREHAQHISLSLSLSLLPLLFALFIFMRAHRRRECVYSVNTIWLHCNAIIGFRLNVCICVLWPDWIESNRYVEIIRTKSSWARAPFSFVFCWLEDIFYII